MNARLQLRRHVLRRRGRGDPQRGPHDRTEHLVLALLIDPASPVAEALGRDLSAARRARDELDNQVLAAIGVEPGSPLHRSWRARAVGCG